MGTNHILRALGDRPEPRSPRKGTGGQMSIVGPNLSLRRSLNGPFKSTVLISDVGG